MTTLPADQLAPGMVLLHNSQPRRIAKLYTHHTSPVLIVRFVDGGLARIDGNETVHIRLLTDIVI